jgi:hypothetical protein
MSIFLEELNVILVSVLAEVRERERERERERAGGRLSG